MAKPKSCTEDNTNNIGIKVNGDLGDLQISTVSESDDDEDTVDKTVGTKKVDTLANFPASLVQTSNTPIFGNVAVANSDNVQFGNNTHFHGPVTIKQIITKSGIENASYAGTEDENVQSEDFKSPQEYNVSSKKKIIIQPWIKIALCVACVILVVIIVTVILLMQGKNRPNESSSNETDPGDSEVPNYKTVVGVWYNNTSLIIFSTILVPLTVLLMLYPLLTPQSSGARRENKSHFTNKDTKRKRNFSENVLTKDVSKADDLLIAPDHLRIVSRSDWLAQPVENKLDKIRQPVPWVVITHTATEHCTFQSECVLRVRLIQMFHIESRGWDDIGYNFLVAGDGSAYFGRGWDYIGAHTLGYNKYSIGIAFIGTFNNEVPPKKQLDACQKLIKLGVKLGKLSKDYKLFAHRQLSSTLSPGDKLYEILKTWPHFVNDTSNISELIPKY